MMKDQNIKPEKITRPIQLLGAWLAGLFSIDSCFLFTASNMQKDSFESYALVVAAIFKVPVFLLAVFLLQTKFRPELQEDSYYSTYLNQKTNKQVTVTKADAHYLEITKKLSLIESQIVNAGNDKNKESDIFGTLSIGINKYIQDLDDIKEKLKLAGVASHSLFGSGEMPKYRILAMSDGLSKNTQLELIKFAQGIGFSHYSFYNKYEEDIMEDVLFGGYGIPQHEIL